MLAVSNFDKAIEFYTKTLGLTLNMRFGDEWAVIDCGGGLLLGLIPKSEDIGPGASVGLGVIATFDEVVETLRERGMSFDTPAIEDRHVKIANFADPDANRLHLTSAPPKPKFHPLILLRS